MKAMILRAPRDLVADDVARPVIEAANDVLVRVTHSGICGTDFKIYSGAIPVSYPRIMGHEMAGEVVADGDSSFPAGARVIVDPELYCGACFHCRIGQTHLCPNGRLLGRDANGGFAEYVAAPRSHVYSLPDTIDSLTAPLVQVLTTCVHAQRQVTVFPGESVAVYGLGVTGQLHVQLAKARGAHPVIGVTRSAEKRALAEKLGADVTIAGGAETAANVREATGGRGADVVIETTGMLPSLAASIDMARSGGRLLLFGIITAKEGALPFYDLYFKELTVVGARVAKSEDYPDSLALVEKGLVRLEPLISNVLPLDQLERAIEMLDSDAAYRMKIIMQHVQERTEERAR
jgi:2-desacetyl-2-hydroxyethyl bacteriochlorophyllide A dehydrogenase